MKKKGNYNIFTCFNCSAKFHNCCAAKYSLVKNIGFNYIFRCPQCETLLKLDEEFVNMVYEEDLEEELPEIELVIEESEIQEEPINEISEVNLEESEPTPVVQTKKVRVGGFFGKEITFETKNSKGEKLSEIPESIKPEEQPISITSLKPPRKKGTGTIKFCKICGATCGALVDSCLTCGAKLD